MYLICFDFNALLTHIPAISLLMQGKLIGLDLTQLIALKQCIEENLIKGYRIAIMANPNHPAAIYQILIKGGLVHEQIQQIRIYTQGTMENKKQQAMQEIGLDPHNPAHQKRVVLVELSMQLDNRYPVYQVNAKKRQCQSQSEVRKKRRLN